MNDMLAPVVWLPITSLLLFSAWRWPRRISPDSSVGTICLHVLVVCWVCLVGNAILLSALGVLSPTLLLGGVVATIACVLWIAKSSRPRLSNEPVYPSSSDRRRSEFGRATQNFDTDGTNAESGKDADRPGRNRSTLPIERWARYWNVPWGVLGALMLARIVLDGLLAFPSDWDTMAYHLPLVDHWIQQGTLYTPDCAFWYSPGNHELLGLWLCAPFSGDFLIGLINVPALVLTAVAAFQLLSLLGVSRPMCHLGAMAIMATGVTWRQAVSAENDLALAGLFLATLVYGMRYARDGRRADLLLAACSVGLLTGMKYYAVGYAGAAGLGVVALVAAMRGRRVAMRTAAVGLAGVLILGGYWYARNAWATGTPLYPKGFTASTDVWGKLRPDTGTSSLAGCGRAEVVPLLADAITVAAGPCGIVAACALPLSALWLAVSAWRGADDKHRNRAWLLMLLVLAGMVFMETPNVVETVPGTMNMLRSQYHPVRFGLCFFSLAIVALAVFTDGVVPSLPRWQIAHRHFESRTRYSFREAREWISRLGASPGSSRKKPGLAPKRLIQRVAALLSIGRFLLLLAWAVGVGYQVYRVTEKDVTVDHLLLAGNLFLGGVLLWALATSASRRERRIARALATAAAIVAVAGTGWLSARWHRDFVQHYDENYFRTPVLAAMSELDPADEQICVCDDRYYPFFGSRRQYRVCRPLWVPDFAELRRYLLSRNVTLLVTRNQDASPRQRYADVKRWTTEYAECFEPFYERRLFTVFRVNRDSLESQSEETP